MPDLIGCGANGTLIRVQSQDGSTIATLGGLISIGFKGVTMIYGFTAGHAVPQRDVSTNYSPRRTDDTDSDAFSETSNVSADEDTDSLSSTDATSLGHAQLSNLQEIGYAARHSLEEAGLVKRNYDRALVCLSDNAPFPKSVPQMASGSNLSPLLVTTTDWASHPNRVRVCAVSGRGKFHGRLVSNASCIRIAPSMEEV